MNRTSLEYNHILTEFFHTERVWTYTLEKIQKACEHFWNPQDTYKCIHIAGTNGKGSVSKMIFQILKESGKKVWVFTSPHLIDIRERFETERWLIGEYDFMKYAEEIIEYGNDLSYFEKCTLLAFLYFRDQWCEYSIIEVGIWWRLDSTNIINPIISVITSIGYDHMELLGNTLEEIAEEKWGIIKPQIPVILYEQNPTLETIAQERGSQIIFPKKRQIITNLLWEHQIKNANIAYEAGRYLWINDEKIRKSLMNVDHHGRMEYIFPNLLIDWAHNEAGLRELKKYLETLRKNPSNRIEYCFNLKQGKSSKLITDMFPEIWNWTIVEWENPLLIDPYLLSDEMQRYWKKTGISSIKNIFAESKNHPETLFVIFWSLYLLGDVLKEKNGYI